MNSQSNWECDRNFESLSLTYLNQRTSLFKDPNFYVTEIVTDKPRQLKGTDLVADIPIRYGPRTIHHLQKVDVKSIAANIPTFSFELSGNVSTNQIGWLINPKIETDYYLLVYHRLMTTSNDYTKNKTSMTLANIRDTESILIKKQHILSLIHEETGLSQEDLNVIPSIIRELVKTRTDEIHRFKIMDGEIVDKRKEDKTNITITISKHLKEQPINILIKKDLLIKNARQVWQIADTNNSEQQNQFRTYKLKLRNRNGNYT